MEPKAERVIHPLNPIYNERSEILILGSFPSVKSREAAFYYGHPQNRFWRVLAEIFQSPLPADNGERRGLILSNRLALWDVIASCRVRGSADNAIAEATPNDLSQILSAAPIGRILVNGRTAEKYYMKFQYPKTGILPTVLPSTSPANAAWSLERLTAAWRAALRG